MIQDVLVAVPNSNPNSAFSRFEIWATRAHVGGHTGGYVLFGISDDDVRRITEFTTLADAKTFLVELNGPLPENAEDEE